MRGANARLLSILLLLCGALLATGNKLRLPRKRALTKEGEELLFTEGRKGGGSKVKGEKGNKNYESGDEWSSPDAAVSGNQWTSPDGTDDMPAKKAKDDDDDDSDDSDEEPEPKKAEAEYDEDAPKKAEPSDEMPKKTSKKGVKGVTSSGDMAVAEEDTAKKGKDSDEPKGAEKDNEGRDGPEPKESKPEPEPPAPAPGPTNDTPVVEPPTGGGTSQVGFVLSQFGLEFKLGSTTSRLPLTMDFAELESATIGYLEEYLELTYNGDVTILFESVEIEATARRTGGTEGTPFIDFEASVAFMANSPNIPSSEEIALTISEALSGRNLATYLFTLAQRLSEDNPFMATTIVTVYMPDSGNTGNDRISTPGASGMSAASIAAAASAGAVTLMIAGFVLFKAKKENSDNMGKFMKGFPGGMTVAGDTYATSTIEATAAHADDTRSMGSSVYYADNQNYISSLPQQGDVLMYRTSDSRPAMQSSPSKTVSFDCSMNNQNTDVESGDSYISPPSKPRKIVQAIKSSPLNNTDLKNYFKSKYKCGSPRGYSPVIESDKKKDQPATKGSESNEKNELDLPSLDHDSVSDTKIQKVQNRRKNRQYEPLQSDSNDNDEEEYYEEVLEDSDEDTSAGVHDLVKSSQSKNTTLNDREKAVPRLPDERTPTDEMTEGGESASIDRDLDEVSLH